MRTKEENKKAALEFEALLKSDRWEDLATCRGALVTTKLTIEQALSQNKMAMLENRSDLIASGIDLREAVILATTGSDHSWRMRATEARRISEMRIARVNARMLEIRPNTGPESKKVVRHAGTPAEIEGSIAAALVAGEHIFAMAGVWDAALQQTVVLAVHGKRSA